MEEKGDARVESLSGGQKQRVAIARSIALQPEVLLLDEPTSALDPESIGSVLETIRRLTKSKHTMLIVTHEMGFAKEVSDQLVFMRDGQVKAIAPPDVMFSNDAPQECQSFIRAMSKTGSGR